MMNETAEINDRIATLIRRKCGRLGILSGGWRLFSFNGRQYICTTDNDGLLQLSIPYLLDSGEYEPDAVARAVNDTNRRVRFIKALLLESGAVSLVCDHLVMDAATAAGIADRIIDTLDKAAYYFVEQLAMSDAAAGAIPWGASNSY